MHVFVKNDFFFFTKLINRIGLNHDTIANLLSTGVGGLEGAKITRIKNLLVCRKLMFL